MDMEKRFPNLTWAALLALLMFSFLVAMPATPARAANPPAGAGEIIAPPYAVAAEPVWATLNAIPQGNYLGGNLEFDAVVVNSDQPPDGNVTLFNETVTAPAFPNDTQSNYGIGLPISLAPGQLIVNTIRLPVPGNFAQGNFTANLVANVALWNGTTNVFLRLTATTVVTILGLPVSGGGQTTSTTSQTGQQSGTVSTSLFAIGVAIPTIVVILLLVLLVRRGSGPK
jgi:hypothetical protein